MGMEHDLSAALAARLKDLRTERGWTLDDLAARTDVSRASLGRIEAGQVSPTAETLNSLATAFGVMTSKLLASAEPPLEPVIRRDDQTIWTDSKSGFVRRSISPPAPFFQAEMIEGRIPAGAIINYDRIARPGVEHHLHMLEGRLRLTNTGRTYDLAAGDTLRWKSFGGSRFESRGPGDARYVLALV